MHTDLCDRLDIEFPDLRVSPLPRRGGRGVAGGGFRRAPARSAPPEHARSSCAGSTDTSATPVRRRHRDPGQYEGKSTARPIPKKLEEMLKR